MRSAQSHSEFVKEVICLPTNHCFDLAKDKAITRELTIQRCPLLATPALQSHSWELITGPISPIVRGCRCHKLIQSRISRTNWLVHELEHVTIFSTFVRERATLTGWSRWCWRVLREGWEWLNNTGTNIEADAVHSDQDIFRWSVQVASVPEVWALKQKSRVESTESQSLVRALNKCRSR